MGGSSGKRTSATKTDEPKAQATYSQPAFMPGMDNMLAQQLAQGGYGDLSSLLASFAPIFTPMTLPDNRPVATPAPATPAPATPAPPSGGNPRSGWLQRSGGRSDPGIWGR